MINENYLPSYFRSVADREPRCIGWDELFNMVKTDSVIAENTQKCRVNRKLGDAHEADKWKRASGAFTPAVQCTGGHARGNIVGHTHMSMVDIDDIPDERMEECKQTVKNDCHTFMAWTTVSEHGLRVIFKYQKEDSVPYVAAWKMGNDYYSQLTGIATDDKTKDDSRLSYLCHDDDIFYNPDSEPFAVSVPEKKKTNRDRELTSEVLFDKAVKIVERQGHRYVAGHHNEYVMHIGYLLNKMGVDESDAVQLCTKAFLDYNRTEDVIRSCYTHISEHGVMRGMEGTLVRLSPEGTKNKHSGNEVEKHKTKGKDNRELRGASVGDVEAFLNANVELRHNVISNETEIREGIVASSKSPPKGRDHRREGEETQKGVDDEWRNLTDRDVNSLWSRFCKSTGKSLRITDLWALINSEFVPLFNPFEEYLGGLPDWNPDNDEDYIKELAGRVDTASDHDRFELYFRKWFVAIIPALLQQTTNQTILVFIGKQGIYKSTWFSRLLPPELQRYFYCKTNSARMNKDDKFTLAEFALVCFEEIDYMKDSDLNQLKAMVTMEQIHERPAYGRVKEHRRHISSFCATGNNLSFLSDPTGNRRWLPFEVTSILSPYDNPINYEGLYSQALYLWKHGFRYWFNIDEIKELNQHNETFEVPDMEAELISKYYRHPRDNETGGFMTVTEIIEHCSALIRRPLNPVKVGLALKKLKFKRKRVKHKYGYVVVERNLDEIVKEQKNDAMNVEDE